IPSLNISSLSLTGASLIQALFRLLNIRKGTFVVADHQSNELSSSSSKLSQYITSFDLYGIETLWRIALECSSDENGKSSAQYLVNLLKLASPDLQAELPNQGEKYIAHCMKELLHAAKESSNEPERSLEGSIHETKILRALFMLQLLVEEFSTDSDSV